MLMLDLYLRCYIIINVTAFKVINITYRKRWYLYTITLKADMNVGLYVQQKEPHMK